MNLIPQAAKDYANKIAAPLLAKGYTKEALHTYTSASGEILLHRVRLKNHSDGEKWIRPFHLNGNGYKSGEPEFPNGKPLYRLHDLASNPDAIVYLVEGEAKADALAKLGLIATTSGSASSAGKADWTPMQGRTVIIWRDFDDAGARYSDECAERLQAIGCAVQRIDVESLGLAEKGDAVDWLKLHPDAYKANVEALPIFEMSATNATISTKVSAHVVLARGDTIKPEPIQWLWNGWLAAGKFHVLAGAPGTGKTTIALAMAATITTGGRWPDGSICNRGSVLIWSGEDSPTDTLAPRLLAMGADMKQVSFITGRRDDDGVLMPFDPASDAPLLVNAMQRNPDIRLMIIDPIVSAVSGDSHKNAEVRRGLQPLVDLGANHDCAILGINHFSKGTAGRDPIERVTGSLAFGALARVVLVTVKNKDAEGNENRIIARAKSNIGPDVGGYSYELRSLELPNHKGVITSAVLWGDPIEGEARDILATAEQTTDDETSSAIDEASEWLADFLAEGPQPQTSVMSNAAANGLTRKTLRNAKERLNVQSKKDGMKGGWQWRLPEDAPKNTKMPLTVSGAPSEIEGHLREAEIENQQTTGARYEL